MRPEFASAIDPIFEGALSLLQKLEAGVSCDPREEHSTILALIDRADIVLGDVRQWTLARYAIAVWIDEMLLSIPWDGAEWWNNHILEMELFQTRICSEHFFELAREASGLSCRDALEVFYNCVILGFRGMYAEVSLDESRVRKNGWPPTIEKWLERTLRSIDVEPWNAPADGPRRCIDGAAPLYGRTQLVWWSIAVVLLLITNCTVYQIFHASK